MERIEQPWWPLCAMCGLRFFGRSDAKTCSPRCRKRRERMLKGHALKRCKMEKPPNPNRSKLWR